jgi:hypothetical protein
MINKLWRAYQWYHKHFQEKQSIYLKPMARESHSTCQKSQVTRDRPLTLCLQCQCLSCATVSGLSVMLRRGDGVSRVLCCINVVPFVQDHSSCMYSYGRKSKVRLRSEGRLRGVWILLGGSLEECLPVRRMEEEEKVFFENLRKKKSRSYKAAFQIARQWNLQSVDVR